MIQHAAQRPLEPNPALARHAQERAQIVQDRLADRITAFADSIAKRQGIADQQWQTVQVEDRQNEELLDLSHQILDLTKAIHSMAAQIEPTAASWQRTSATSVANPPKETR